jgi:hypothetical protein
VVRLRLGREDIYSLTRLLKREPRASGSLLDSVQFDTKGWTLAKRSRDSLEWCNADGDTLRACVHSKLTGTLSGLSDRDSLRAFYREEVIRHGGGIDSVDCNVPIGFTEYMQWQWQ